ncbi:AAA family ATPase [Saccharothrix sp. AJ9571]|nr:AAA family ATPase [Saccharothrix sp. AJ9571]
MDLIVIFGPPAVGKMAVGEELCRRTGYSLVHNHLMMEPLLTVFPYGSTPFNRLTGEFRRRIFEEGAAAHLPGMVFTFVWGLELPEDAELVASHAETTRGPMRFVELAADLDVRLERNTTDLRLERKPSKRDLAASRENLLHLDRGYTMNTGAGICAEAQQLLDRHGHLKIDNTHLTTDQAAATIIRELRLPSAS